MPLEQTPLTLAQSSSGITDNAPLFSTILNYRHSEERVGVEEIDEAFEYDIELISSQERTNYPFSLSVDDFGVGFALDLQLDRSIDIHRVMAYMQTALVQLTEHLVSSPDKPINTLSVLPKEESDYLINKLNDRVLDYPNDKCIHELFEQQARENPDNVAVVFEDEQLTYRELNAQANQLAHYLVETQGVKPDTLVGLCVERSLEMVIGILGILKAGGAYVPLDPNNPQERIDYILQDSAVSLLLTHTNVSTNISFVEEP